MRRPLLALALAVSALVPVGHAFAASGDITVGVNESRRIPLHGLASTVVIGDPKVADVSMTDAHSVILIGRGYGVTRLLVTDANGHFLLQGRVAVVDGDDGRVTYYRGGDTSDYACSGGRCHAVPAGGGGGDSGAMPVTEGAEVSNSGSFGPGNSQPIQPSPGIP